MVMSTKIRPSKLALESLEDRLVLHCDAAAINIQAGELTIRTTDANDTVVVSPLYFHGRIYAYNVKVNGVCNESFPASQVYSGKVFFDGLGGDDYFRNDTNLKATAYGRKGNDHLIGGSNDDLLFGTDSNYGTDPNEKDWVEGRGGNDNMAGSAGDDTLDGGTGNDAIAGAKGNDVLIGRDGDDKLVGNDGNDVLFGGAGKDTLYGLAGKDKLFGGAGLDYLYGGDDNDFLDGGHDFIADVLDGGTGADQFKKDMFFGFNVDKSATFKVGEGDVYIP